LFELNLKYPPTACEDFEEIYGKDLEKWKKDAIEEF